MQVVVAAQEIGTKCHSKFESEVPLGKTMKIPTHASESDMISIALIQARMGVQGMRTHIFTSLMDPMASVIVCTRLPVSFRLLRLSRATIFADHSCSGMSVSTITTARIADGPRINQLATSTPDSMRSPRKGTNSIRIVS
jgi:hypothetical protein